ETLGGDEVDVIHLARPAPHRDVCGDRPDLGPDVISGETSLFFEFSTQGLLRVLPRFDPAAGGDPQPIVELGPVPVEVDEQYVVVRVDDERSGTVSKWHCC